MLSLIRHTIEAGNKAGIPVAMCGEMAGDPRFVRLLLGLGLTDFSMPPNLLLEVKRSLMEIRLAAVKKKANKLMKAHSVEERMAILARINGSSVDA